MSGTCLFVGNLPYATSEQDLHDLFAKTAGKVKSVKVSLARGRYLIRLPASSAALLTFAPTAA